MNRSIFRAELRNFRTYTIVWCVVLIFTIGANIGGSVSMVAKNPDYRVLDIFAQSAISMLMTVSIFSMILGGLVISREEDDRTIEFLLSHPVTRMQIAWSKLAALVLLVLSLMVVLLVADVVFLQIFKSPAGYDFGPVLGIWLSELVFTLFFAAAGMFYSQFVTKGGAVVGSCIGIPLVMNLLASLGTLGNNLLRILSYLSPFKYFDVGAILRTGSAQPAFIAIFLAIGAAFVAAAMLLYRRREFAV